MQVASTVLLDNCECCSQSRDPSVLLLQPSALGSSVSFIRACHDIGAAAHVGVTSLSCLCLCGVSLCTDIVLWLWSTHRSEQRYGLQTNAMLAKTYHDSLSQMSLFIYKPRHSGQPSHLPDHVHFFFHTCLWPAHHDLHTSVTSTQKIQRLLSHCKSKQFRILYWPWALDFVIKEALVALFFVETPSIMHKQEHIRHTKSVAGVSSWMRLLSPASLAWTGSDEVLLSMFEWGIGHLPRHSEQPPHLPDHIHFVFHACLWPAHHDLHTSVTITQKIQHLLSHCRNQQCCILHWPWALDFVLGEALVTPPTMHKREHKRHAKSVAGMSPWMRLLSPASLAWAGSDEVLSFSQCSNDAMMRRILKANNAAFCTDLERSAWSSR